jgi:hypothetical protein
MRAGADVQVHVRLRQAQVGEEHAGHPRVVVLARVNERLVDAGLAECADDGRGLHEVRPGTKHMRNQSLHRCPLPESNKRDISHEPQRPWPPDESLPTIA